VTPISTTDTLQEPFQLDSTEITILERSEKAEPSMNSSSRQSEEVEGSQPKAWNQEDYIPVSFLYL
jgi:hypothetical protein